MLAEANLKLVIAAREFQKIARTLRQWARDSEQGGWSTHQVRPQRELSVEIEDIVDMLGRPAV